MKLSIKPNVATPPFEQLRRQVIDGVADETFKPGARMPTVRRLAAELGLAINTVAKAYRALETDGVIETRGRAGSFIAPTGDATTREGQRAAITYATRVHHLGLDRATALKLVTSALDART